MEKLPLWLQYISALREQPYPVFYLFFSCSSSLCQFPYGNRFLITKNIVCLLMKPLTWKQYSKTAVQKNNMTSYDLMFWFVSLGPLKKMQQLKHTAWGLTQCLGVLINQLKKQPPVATPPPPVYGQFAITECPQVSSGQLTDLLMQ